MRLAAVLLTVAPTVTPRLAGAATPVPAPAAVAPYGLTQPAPPPSSSTPDHSPSRITTTVHLVCPGDTLWDLAKHHLNDPLRWRELYDINRGRLQPDGRHLEEPGLIRPGWRLEIPVPDPPFPVPTAETVALQAKAPAPAARSADAASPASRVEAPDPSPSAVARPPSAPESGSRPAEQAPTAAQPATAGSGRSDDEGEPGRARLAVLGIPTVMAGAFLGYLGLLRRNRERWRRRHHRFPTPTPVQTDIERAVRAVPGAEAVTWVDLAMRHLAAAIAEESAPPAPGVLAVRVGDLGVEVLISRPWPVAPGRFIAIEDGHIWRLDPAVALEELEQLACGVPAYLPALVTAGETEAGSVLVDLDEIGTLTVSGDPDHVVAALERIALELATLPWGDTLDVCLVGVGSRLRDLDRVRILEPDQALESLRRVAGPAATGGLAAAAMSDIPPGPTVVLVTPDALDPVDLADVLDLAQPHSGLAVVAAGPPTAGNWRLAIAPSGEGLLAPLGVALRSCTDVHNILEIQEILMETAKRDTDLPVETITGEEDGAEPNRTVDETAAGEAAAEKAAADAAAAEKAAADAADLAPSPGGECAEPDLEVSTTLVEVNVIGPIEVTWPAEVPRPQVAEFVTYLATHPPSVGSERARLALWPATEADERFGERSQGTFSNLTYKARRALGSDACGEPLLRRDRGTNAFSLSDAVACDWIAFRRFTARASRPSADTKRELLSALALVRGRPFHDPPPGYAWVELERIDNEIEAAVADAALDLCDLCLSTGDIDTARWAVRQGQLCVPHSEALLRAAMRVAAAAGDRSGIDQAWQHARRLAAELDACGEPEPATIELYRELRASSPRGA